MKLSDFTQPGKLEGGTSDDAKFISSGKVCNYAMVRKLRTHTPPLATKTPT